MQLPEKTTEVVFPALSPRKGLGSCLVSPVLSSRDSRFAVGGRLLTPRGGPPRVRRLPTVDCCNEQQTLLQVPSLATLTSSASTASTRRLGRWPVKGEHLPSTPRLAKIRRPPPRPEEEIWNDQAMRALRALHASRVNEDDSDNDDSEDEEPDYDSASAAPLDSDSLSLGQKRLILNRGVGRHFRRKAARYQKRRNFQENLYKLRWSLQSLFPGQAVNTSTDLPFSSTHEQGEAEKEEQELRPPPAPPSSPVDWPKVDEARQERTIQHDSDSEDHAVDRKTEVTKSFMERMQNRRHVLSESRRRRLETKRKEQRMAEKQKTDGNEQDGTDRTLGGSDTPRPRVQNDESQDSAEQMRDVDIRAILSKIRGKEAYTYRIIFNMYDNSSTGMVDYADLQGLLADLGFHPRNEEERNLVVKVLHGVHSLEVDFTTLVEEIIPKIRVGLAEAREPGIRDLFTSADTDNSGSLSVQELVFILHRSGFYSTPSDVVTAIKELLPDARRLAETMDGHILTDANCLRLNHVRVLAPILQERAGYDRVFQSYVIAEDLCLDEEARLLWRETLVDCRNAFFAQLGANEKYLPVRKMLYVLIEIDLIPKQGNVRQVLDMLIDEELQHADEKSFVDFPQCVNILGKIRAKECERVCEIFRKNDSDRTNGLSLVECLKCLQECGIKAMNAKESARLMNVVDEFDADGSGELDLTEFLGLVKFVSLRMRKMRRRDQADLAASYGWHQEVFDSMRSAFLEADSNLAQRLNETQLAVCLQKLRPNWRRERTVDVLKEMGLLRATALVSVDLFQLLDLVRFLDRRMKHLDVAYSIGLDQESQEQFIASWLKMGPDWEEDMVQIEVLVEALKHSPGFPKRMGRVQELINAGNSKLNFAQYVLIMRRTYTVNTNAEEKQVPAAPVPKGLKKVFG